MAFLSTVSRSNWNLEMLVFVEGGKPEYPEKNPRSRDEYQQQTQPTYDAETGNRTRVNWWEASALITAPSLLSTELSKHVWHLKDAGLGFNITWKILKQAAPFNPASNCCNLCLW